MNADDRNRLREILRNGQTAWRMCEDEADAVTDQVKKAFLRGKAEGIRELYFQLKPMAGLGKLEEP